MDVQSPDTLGELLARYRQQHHLTQLELAQRASISERTIQDIENGRVFTPRRDTVQSLETALGLTTAERTQFEACVAKAKAARTHRGAPPGESPLPNPQSATSAHLSPVRQSPFSLPVNGKQGILLLLAGSLIVGGLVVAALLIIPRFGPSCPPPHLEGVTLYELPCYGGRSMTLTESDLYLCEKPLDPTRGKVDPCFSAPSWNDIMSSAWVGPGYRAEFHLHSPIDADDSWRAFECGTGLPDLSKLSFPNGASMDNSISRVDISKMECH